MCECFDCVWCVCECGGVFEFKWFIVSWCVMIDGRVWCVVWCWMWVWYGVRCDVEWGLWCEWCVNGVNDGDGGDFESVEWGEGVDECVWGWWWWWFCCEFVCVVVGVDVGDKFYEWCVCVMVVWVWDESDDVVEAREAIEREIDEKRAGRDERRVVCMEENEVK